MRAPAEVTEAQVVNLGSEDWGSPLCRPLLPVPPMGGGGLLGGGGGGGVIRFGKGVEVTIRLLLDMELVSDLLPVVPAGLSSESDGLF